MNIIQINSSMLGEKSISTKYASLLTQKLLAKNIGSNLVVRDVSQKPVTPLSSDILPKMNDLTHPVGQEFNMLIEEIKQANIVVIAAPMYNFSIPSTLKNYFDAIIQAGVTFKYTENGPIGYLTNKKVYIVLSRGGYYKNQSITFQEDYLKMMLGFIGMNDIEFIYVEGVATGASMESIEEIATNQINLVLQ